MNRTLSGRLAVRVEHRLVGLEQAEDLPLVVRRAAGVQLAVSDGGRERGRVPFLDRDRAAGRRSARRSGASGGRERRALGPDHRDVRRPRSGPPPDSRAGSARRGATRRPGGCPRRERAEVLTLGIERKSESSCSRRGCSRSTKVVSMGLSIRRLTRREGRRVSHLTAGPPARAYAPIPQTDTRAGIRRQRRRSGGYDAAEDSQPPARPRRGPGHHHRHLGLRPGHLTDRRSPPRYHRRPVGRGARQFRIDTAAVRDTTDTSGVRNPSGYQGMERDTTLVPSGATSASTASGSTDTPKLDPSGTTAGDSSRVTPDSTQ